MSYSGGFYYSKPQVGDRCLFIYALDLLRGSEYVDDGYDAYLFPETFKGTILTITDEEVVDWKEDPIFNFTVKRESGDKIGQATEEYSTRYVIVKTQEELDMFLQKTKEEAINKMEVELNRRKEAFVAYCNDTRKTINDA